MKITRRPDTGKSGQVLISVPPRRVMDVEAALTFLEAQRRCTFNLHRLDIPLPASLPFRWAVPYAHRPQQSWRYRLRCATPTFSCSPSTYIHSHI